MPFNNQTLHQAVKHFMFQVFQMFLMFLQNKSYIDRKPLVASTHSNMIVNTAFNATEKMNKWFSPPFSHREMLVFF